MGIVSWHYDFVREYPGKSHIRWFLSQETDRKRDFHLPNGFYRKERAIQRHSYPLFSKQGSGVNRNSLAICTNAASKDWGNSQKKIHSLITASRKPIGLVWIVPERGVERISPDAAGHVAATFRTAAGTLESRIVGEMKNEGCPPKRKASASREILAKSPVTRKNAVKRKVRVSSLRMILHSMLSGGDLQLEGRYNSG